MNDDAKVWRSHLAIAEQAARRAGVELARRLADWTVAKSVARHDLKLSGDAKSELLITAALTESFDIPILAEEGGSTGSPHPGGLNWVVDPLDGTFNYARAIPLCCVSIALRKGEAPLIGVVHDFVRDETFTGIAGVAAWLNGAAVRVSDIGQPGHAVLATGLPAKRDYSAPALAEFGRSLGDWGKVRMLGSAALSLAYVAAGRLDAYYEQSIMPWDVAAGIALVQAAGGVAHRSAGPPGGAIDVAAANPRLMASAFPAFK